MTIGLSFQVVNNNQGRHHLTLMNNAKLTVRFAYKEPDRVELTATSVRGDPNIFRTNSGKPTATLPLTSTTTEIVINPEIRDSVVEVMAIIEVHGAKPFEENMGTWEVSRI